MAFISKCNLQIHKISNFPCNILNLGAPFVKTSSSNVFSCLLTQACWKSCLKRKDRGHKRAYNLTWQYPTWCWCMSSCFCWDEFASFHWQMRIHTEFGCTAGKQETATSQVRHLPNIPCNSPQICPKRSGFLCVFVPTNSWKLPNHTSPTSDCIYSLTNGKEAAKNV